MNRTERGFIIVDALNLHILHIFPFDFTTYTSYEKFCFSEEYTGFIGQQYLITLCQGPFIASPLQLILSVRADKETYQMNESIHVIVSVTNVAKESAIVFFPDSQIADYRIRDANNQTIYLWSQNRFFFPAETSLLLLRNKTISILTDDWNQTDNGGNQVPQGFYRLEGAIPSSWYCGEVYSDPVLFQIE